MASENGQRDRLGDDLVGGHRESDEQRREREVEGEHGGQVAAGVRERRRDARRHHEQSHNQVQIVEAYRRQRQQVSRCRCRRRRHRVGRRLSDEKSTCNVLTARRLIVVVVSEEAVVGLVDEKGEASGEYVADGLVAELDALAGQLHVGHDEQQGGEQVKAGRRRWQRGAPHSSPPGGTRPRGGARVKALAKRVLVVRVDAERSARGKRVANGQCGGQGEQTHVRAHGARGQLEGQKERMTGSSSRIFNCERIGESEQFAEADEARR